MILDTHVWIWVAAGDAHRIGARTRRLIDRAAASGSLYLSAASAFEVAALHTTGRLHLTQSVEAWFRESLHRLGARIVDVDSPTAIDAGLVPVSSLPDPFDRLIVAAARALDVKLVTSDRRILEYAVGTRFVQTTDASK